ncbi:MAG TPA: AIR synthase-related protein [Methanoregulaceae archaeon]|nr:AIR synthase-related protein [Methanoregulaceae archaeon]
MDVEEFVRRGVRRGESRDDIIGNLADHIMRMKPVTRDYAESFANAVFSEVKNTTGLSGDFFSYEPSGVRMGEFGVGSRGTGDFFAHRQIARVIGKTSASVGVDEMDDAGAVRVPGGQFQKGYDGSRQKEGNLNEVRAGDTDHYVVCTVDGMHSRLSDFPFLAGFHVTRATLRDVYVMGAYPLMLFSDIHVADDGDVAKIFDYTAGITAVGEVMEVPLVTGSTLRIGGDMVLGSRMTGCVGAVGIASHLTARKETKPGDVILMTEGAGGGTIATAALYSGYPEVVEATINLNFLISAEALLRSDALASIHSMTDVTNGGLRGDVYEMAETAGCRIVIEEEAVRSLVRIEVSDMLETLSIDYLGVSLDALLIAAPRPAVDTITRIIRDSGVMIHEIGHVEAGQASAVLEKDGKACDFTPKFRESAYTPLKKVVDAMPGNFDEMKSKVKASADAAIAKKNRVIDRIRPCTKSD